MVFASCRPPKRAALRGRPRAAALRGSRLWVEEGQTTPGRVGGMATTRRTATAAPQICRAPSGGASHRPGRACRPSGLTGTASGGGRRKVFETPARPRRRPCGAPSRERTLSPPATRRRTRIPFTSGPRAIRRHPAATLRDPHVGRDARAG